MPSALPPESADTVDHRRVASESSRVDEGRRDRKKSVTRKAIRAAALQLVDERGFAHVTVEDIAALADIAPRTFFNYFASKESAVVGGDSDRVEAIRTSLLGRPLSESPLQALRNALVEYATTLEAEFDERGEAQSSWFKVFQIVRKDPDLLGAYAAHVADVERQVSLAVAERLGVDPVSDPFPALLTATLLAATRVASLHWSADGGVDSLARLTAVAIDTLAAGLADTSAFASPIRFEKTNSPTPFESRTTLTDRTL
jgi:AcrR family transcriptional regulator